MQDKLAELDPVVSASEDEADDDHRAAWTPVDVETDCTTESDICKSGFKVNVNDTRTRDFWLKRWDVLPHIQLLGVDTSERGRGVASALVDSMTVHVSPRLLFSLVARCLCYSHTRPIQDRMMLVQ